MTNITDTSQDDRTMAVITYIIAIFSTFLGPLIIWLIKKDQSKFIAYHALQALIFNAAVAVGYLIASMTAIFLIGLLILPIVGIIHVVFMILAAVASSKGEWYEIPVVGKFARQAAGI